MMMTIISREEWLRRYAARIKERAATDDAFAMQCAEAGAEAYEQGERAAGNVLIWEDTPMCNPEEQADEELSCWTDDGD
jgi:hypothetical protein